ncbi:MAG: hypothetical protein GY795_37065 [Desulfobacterales bacterium]|nr:hypothetical protein [Desulfobacterales bacterium]
MIKYAFFDGDNVGNSIENLLNSKRVIEATHLSESIKHAIFEIEQFVGSLNDIELLIAGGDDVLIKYDSEQYNLKLLERIPNIFNKYTGLSMSCGVGENIEESINNLVIAKKQSKGSIKTKNEETDMQDQTVKKKTKLYIFTTSFIPDPYINVIAHCEAYYKNLNQIVLIGITEDPGQIELTNARLKQLKEDIKEKTTYLSQGKYLKKNIDNKPELIDIDLEPTNIERYSKLKDVNPDVQVIVYEYLEEEISKIINSGDSFSYVFDVTALLKNYLVDLYNILRFKNISSIYYLELINKQTFDQRDLIHNLTYNRTYKYNCLSESKYTKDKIIVSDISTISENKYNQLMSAFQILEKNRNNLEEKIANSFASKWLFIYSSIGIPIITWVCWSIAQGGWSKIKSLSFVITLVWYFLNYLLQSIFTGKFPSLDPRELFTVLKNWKKKKLEKHRSISDKDGYTFLEESAKIQNNTEDVEKQKRIDTLKLM